MDIPVYLCADCGKDDEIQQLLDITEEDFEPSDEQKCQLCQKALDGTCFAIDSVKISDELADEIGCSIYACSECGVTWDSEDDEPVINDTNCELTEAIAEFVEGLKESSIYYQLLKLFTSEGTWDNIEFEGIHCGGCGADLEDTFGEVKVRRIHRIVPQPPALPAEVTAALSAETPADLIEYYRSDSSNYLVHLTKHNTLETFYDNLSYENQTEELTAAEILWLILKEKKLKALQGEGMKAPAVCFTDKPLTALKDTLIGYESNVRKKTRAIQWRCYGLMFSKKYLSKFSVRPTLHLAPKEYRSTPKELHHLAVTYSEKSQWLHEREWRCGEDVAFDTREAIVLLPIFEHVGPFRKALKKEGIVVRGFLPLLDLFACC